jgi:hypothetical protein
VFHTRNYGSVERALFETFGIEPKDMPRVRGRLAALRRGGLLGEAAAVGKGQDVKYTPVEFHKLACALALSQVGLPPRAILAVVVGDADHVLAGFHEAERIVPNPPGARKEANDIYMIVTGLNLIWPDAPPPQVWFLPRGKLGDVPHLNPRSANAVTVNISRLMRLFHSLFVEVHDLDETVQIEPSPIFRLNKLEPRKAAKHKRAALFIIKDAAKPPKKRK